MSVPTQSWDIMPYNSASSGKQSVHVSWIKPDVFAPGSGSSVGPPGTVAAPSRQEQTPSLCGKDCPPLVPWGIRVSPGLRWQASPPWDGADCPTQGGESSWMAQPGDWAAEGGHPPRRPSPMTGCDMRHMPCRTHYRRPSVPVCLGPSCPWTWGRWHDRREPPSHS